jgi:hypothetical protein
MLLLRCLFLSAAVMTLGGCFAPSQPGMADPTVAGHAKWCEQNPPSGYCIVAEPH